MSCARVIVAFLLGVFTTIAVAWGIAAWSPLECGDEASALIDPGNDGQRPMWIAHEFSRPGSRTILGMPVLSEVQQTTYTSWRDSREPGVLPAARELDDPARHAPRWSMLHDDPAAHLSAALEYRVGWPCLALGSRVTRVHDPDSPYLDDIVVTLEGGIALREITTPRTIRNLPLWPIPRGFAINALLYSGVWMVVVRRRGRGREEGDEGTRGPGSEGTREQGNEGTRERGREGTIF